jgi:hypothetical protein
LQSHTDPIDTALALDRRVGEHVQPFYADQATNDSSRLGMLRHTVFGDPPPNPATQEPDRVDFTRLRAAAMLGPVVFRAFFRMFGMLELPETVYRDPYVVERVNQVLTAHRSPPRAPQPTREDLLLALGNDRLG